MSRGRSDNLGASDRALSGLSPRTCRDLRIHYSLQRWGDVGEMRRLGISPPGPINRRVNVTRAELGEAGPVAKAIGLQQERSDASSYVQRIVPSGSARGCL